MTPSKSTLSALLGGLLLGGLGLPRVSSGAQSCTNASLSGTYNASVQSANFQNVIQSLTPAPASTGSTGSTGGGATTGSTATPGDSGTPNTSGVSGVFGGPVVAGGPGSIGGSATTGAAATTAAAATTGGLGGNPASLSGNIPGLGRYFFDGNGNIIGLSVANGASQSSNSTVGSYSVNADCSARLNLNSGQAFDGMIVESGDQVLFVETDAAGSGAVGTLQKSRNFCSGLEVPSSLGFSFFGAQTAAAAGSTGTTGSTSAPTLMPYGAIGAVNILSNSGFQMTASVVQNGAVQRVTGTGTYSVGADCSLKLTLNSSSLGGSTGAVSALTPLAFRGLLSGSGQGVLMVQPSNGLLVTGNFVAQ